MHHIQQVKLQFVPMNTDVLDDVFNDAAEPFEPIALGISEESFSITSTTVSSVFRNSRTSRWGLHACSPYVGVQGMATAGTFMGAGRTDCDVGQLHGRLQSFRRFVSECASGVMMGSCNRSCDPSSGCINAPDSVLCDDEIPALDVCDSGLGAAVAPLRFVVG